MSTFRDFGIAAVSGGAATFVLQGIIGMFKARGETKRKYQDADVRMETHRDQLTFDLLNAARLEMSQLREEVSELHMARGRLAHMEEALDHVHALLNADSDEEMKAARKRARAFLKRMRPEIGDLRNRRQLRESAENIGINPQDGTVS